MKLTAKKTAHPQEEAKGLEIMVKTLEDRTKLNDAVKVLSHSILLSIVLAAEPTAVLSKSCSKALTHIKGVLGFSHDKLDPRLYAKIFDSKSGKASSNSKNLSDASTNDGSQSSFSSSSTDGVSAVQQVAQPPIKKLKTFGK